MTGKTFYDALRVSQDASTEQIRESYKNLIKVCHPDRFDKMRQPQEWDLANALMQELNQAKDTLCDPILRQEYDESIREPTTQPTPPSPTSQPVTQPPRARTQPSQRPPTQPTPRPAARPSQRPPTQPPPRAQTGPFQRPPTQSPPRPQASPSQRPPTQPPPQSPKPSIRNYIGTPPGNKVEPQTASMDAPGTRANVGPPPRQRWTPNIPSGGFNFNKQPSSVKMTLVARSENRLSDQLRVQIEKHSLWTYAVLIGFLAFCGWKATHPAHALPGDFVPILGWCMVFGPLLAAGMHATIRQYGTSLKNWLIVTPLYLVRTDFDQVFAWPIWEVELVGSPYGRVVTLATGTDGSELVFKLPAAVSHETFSRFLAEKKRRVDAALTSRDVQFFDEHNDLASATFTSARPVSYGPPLAAKALAVGSVILGLAITITHS